MPFLFASSRSTARTAVVGAFFAAIAIASTTRACSVCGCSLSSDWSAQGFPDFPGLQAAMRYEYYDNTDLRRGRQHIAAATFALPNELEVQRETLNCNAWLGLDYVGTHDWALSAQIPYYDRHHSTVAPGDSVLSESRAAGVGDVRLLARYDRLTVYRSWGLQFGLRLPTGRYDQRFDTGPAAGMPLDRGLQLGTGTTDLLGGISYFRRPIPNLGIFAQLLLDQPLAPRDGFVPGTSVGLNAGVRYLNRTRVTPQLQLNARYDSREHGTNADTPNSGGTLAYASPGVTIETTAKSTAFVFVQLPFVQRVNGLQLEPHAIVSIGANWRL